MNPKAWVSDFVAQGPLLGAKPYTRFLIASDGAGWVLDEESRELIGIAERLGVDARKVARPWASLPQCVHYASHFSIAKPSVFKTKHRISMDYFHGKPNQSPEFDQVFQMLKRHREQIAKVRISYSEMRAVVRAAGIEDARIHQIPIGINDTYFQWRTPELQARVRKELQIPSDAFVVGSFQKDGAGWGDGEQPKWVKGPDVFLASLEKIKAEVGTSLWVLLTGPARGFVKRGLEKLGIPYRHSYLSDYREVSRFYPALDVYLVASREEGGPKSILESMVAGVPMVSTRVGQAIDLVCHQQNGWLSDVEDVNGLAKGVLAVRGSDPATLAAQLTAGRETGMQNTYGAQTALWREFFRGYVDAVAS